MFCSNESTFVTDDLARCLSCVSLVVQCAFDVNLDIGISQRPTKHGFSGVPVRFLFLIVGKKGVCGKEAIALSLDNINSYDPITSLANR